MRRGGILTQARERLYFPGISMDELQHPSDRKALSALRKVRGLDVITRKMIEWGLEGKIRKELMASCLRVSEKQCPSLYGLYVDCTRTLGVEDPPELFVECNPHPSSYIVGVTKAMVVLSTGLIDVMDEGELRFVLGHMLGHHLCQHVLYQTMARYISQILDLVARTTLGVGGLVGKPLEVALMSWSRVSEFSADRAGLLACQDLDTALRALVKLGVPSKKLWSEVNIEELLKQAAELEPELEVEVPPEGRLAKLKGKLGQLKEKLSKLTIGTRAQPWPVLRIRELVKWARSGEYEAILAKGEPLEPLG